MKFFELITALFGATGFWKGAELLFRYINQQKRQAAEAKVLNAQAQTEIVGNWIQWSQTLEKRVKELEAVAEENKQLTNQIDSQRKRISELESKVEKVEKENSDLRAQLNDLTNTHHTNG